jgi:hypothetical protein
MRNPGVTRRQWGIVRMGGFNITLCNNLILRPGRLEIEVTL